MKHKTVFSSCLMFVFVFSAGVSFSQTSAEYKAKIETINKEMVKYMLEGNTEKTLSLYASDAISLPSYEPMHEGIAAIRKASEEMSKSGWKCISFEPTTVKVLVNGNQITEIGLYKISFSMTGMDKPMDDHGKYLTVWEKQNDGSLKVKIETWNSDVNPMSMMHSMEMTGGEKKK